MNRIDEVKKLLRDYAHDNRKLRKHYAIPTTHDTFSTDVYAKAIKQLYEPQPELESDPEFIGEELLKEASQPDQSRLLTDEELRETAPSGSWYVGCLQCAKRVAKAQRDLTASIKDREVELLNIQIKACDFVIEDLKSRIEALIERLDEPCPHGTKVEDTSRANKRECEICWQELKANPTSEVEG